MSILDGASFWRNTVVPNFSNGSAVSKRIPFTLTSTLRLLRSGAIGTAGLSARQDAQTSSRRELLAIESAGRGAAMVNLACQTSAQY